MVKRSPSELRPATRRAVTAAALAVPLLAAATPLLPEPVRGALMTLFDPLCHQLPQRSFALAGHQFALCHRCFGVVAGVALGAILAPALARFINPANGRGLLTLAVAAIPAAIDWSLDAAGLWVNTPLTRTATGAIFGAAAGALLVLSAALAPSAPPQTQSAPPGG